MNRLWRHHEDSLLNADPWYSSIFEKSQIRALYHIIAILAIVFTDSCSLYTTSRLSMTCGWVAGFIDISDFAEW